MTQGTDTPEQRQALLDWLDVQFDADMALTREASPRADRYDHWKTGTADERGHDGAWRKVPAVATGGYGHTVAVCHEQATAEHIANWDPIHAREQIDALRSLITFTVRPYLGNGETSGTNAWLALRLIAQPYRRRDGWLNEWLP